MGHGFKHGASGAQLNFKVVGGTTEPANPKENMIWVNTAQKITSYIFSATEPTDSVEGMVWFLVGNSSPVKFDALKKNGILVYPISAKQYVSGAWADVTAKIYQKGEWVDVARYLYNAGDECIDLTGGWAVGCTVRSDSYSSWETIAQKNTDHMLIGVSSNSSMQRIVWAKATKKIDLTNINTLVIEYELTGTYSTAALHVGDSAYTESALVSSFVATADLTSESNTVTLDVTNVSGLYYVFAKVYFASNVSTNCNLKIKKIGYQM